MAGSESDQVQGRAGIHASKNLQCGALEIAWEIMDGASVWTEGALPGKEL